jgi:hypothetical protein
MRATVILLVVGLLVGSMAVAAPAVGTDKAFLWTGKHWTQVSEEGKAGYVFGIGNLADFETAASRGRPTACVSKAFVLDLKSRTVMQIIQAVDKFYRDNPGKLDTPVIEVILRRYSKVCPPGTPGGAKKR